MIFVFDLFKQHFYHLLVKEIQDWLL